MDTNKYTKSDVLLDILLDSMVSKHVCVRHNVYRQETHINKQLFISYITVTNSNVIISLEKDSDENSNSGIIKVYSNTHNLHEISISSLDILIPNFTSCIHPNFNKWWQYFYNHSDREDKWFDFVKLSIRADGTKLESMIREKNIDLLI